MIQDEPGEMQVRREKYRKKKKKHLNEGRGNKDVYQVSDLAISRWWYHSLKRRYSMKGKMKGLALERLR